MPTRPPIVVGEWYHCYNRGVDKRRVFESNSERNRFLALLYLSNSSEAIHISNLPSQDLRYIFSDKFGNERKTIVEIGAYALMNNHVHFILKEIVPGGIARFMQKVFTGYTMYFNKKRERTGALFAGTFKSKHLHDDEYLKMAVPYVLLNPAELFESGWKQGIVANKNIHKKLLEYRYSSLPDFVGTLRPESRIVGNSLKEYYDSVPTLEEMVSDALRYYQQFENIKVKP